MRARTARSDRRKEGALRVLVVDDEVSVRRILGEIIATGGHEVWTVASGDEGLTFLERQPVDLVLTDLVMPGMTGWEVARRVKGRWPEVKVGIVSGRVSQVEDAELAEKGVDFFCPKPIQMQALLGTLDAL